MAGLDQAQVARWVELPACAPQCKQLLPRKSLYALQHMPVAWHSMQHVTGSCGPMGRAACMHNAVSALAAPYHPITLEPSTSYTGRQWNHRPIVSMKSPCKAKPRTATMARAMPFRAAGTPGTPPASGPLPTPSARSRRNEAVSYPKRMTSPKPSRSVAEMSRVSLMNVPFLPRPSQSSGMSCSNAHMDRAHSIHANAVARGPALEILHNQLLPLFVPFEQRMPEDASRLLFRLIGGEEREDARQPPRHAPRLELQVTLGRTTHDGYSLVHGEHLCSPQV